MVKNTTDDECCPVQKDLRGGTHGFYPDPHVCDRDRCAWWDKERAQCCIRTLTFSILKIARGRDRKL